MSDVSYYKCCKIHNLAVAVVYIKLKVYEKKMPFFFLEIRKKNSTNAYNIPPYLAKKRNSSACVSLFASCWQMCIPLEFNIRFIPKW